jgi:cytochrome b subunit of formate dehydrogenase
MLQRLGCTIGIVFGWNGIFLLFPYDFSPNARISDNLLFILHFIKQIMCQYYLIVHIWTEKFSGRSNLLHVSGVLFIGIQ